MADPSTNSLANQASDGNDGIFVHQITHPLPDLMDIQINEEDCFGVAHGILDFAWLDSLPVDLDAAEYPDFVAFGDSTSGV
jgi:hypothetical protein